MGQYHKFVNFDKRQYIYPDKGAKLMEFSWHGNSYVDTASYLIQNEWKGDRVALVGDYSFLAGNEPVTGEILRNLWKEFGTTNLYKFGEEYRPYRQQQKSYRYISNDNKKIYIDMKDQPIQSAWLSEKDGKIHVSRIHPLPLLLALSNGMGGGDYEGECGMWACDMGHISLSGEVPDGYSNARISFSERPAKIFGVNVLSGFPKEMNDIDVIKSARLEFPEREIDEGFLYLTDNEKKKIFAE